MTLAVLHLSLGETMKRQETRSVQHTTVNRDFSYKNEKKLKPEKVFRFQCGGYIDNGSDKNGKKVLYKAEYQRPVEEFIYPSLQPPQESKDKSRVIFGAESRSRVEDCGLLWKFNVDEIKPTEIPTRNFLMKVEKGERFLRESLKTRYHGRVLAEVKEREEKRQEDSKSSPSLSILKDKLARRENVLKSTLVQERSIDSGSPDELVMRKLYFYDSLTSL
jgi:hypothetical protein